MPTGRRRIAHVALCCGVFLTAFLYRFDSLGGSLGGFSNDEFGYLARARQIQAGDVPFRDFNDPGWFLTDYVSAGAQWLGGYNLRSQALLTIGMLSIAAVLTFLLAWRAAGSLLAALVAVAIQIALDPRHYNYPKLVLYAAAAAAYVAHFAWRDPRTGRLATSILAGGVVAHTFLIGMQTVQGGHAPLVGTTAAISAFVWLLALSYLYVEQTTDERAMGVFVSSLMVGLYIIPALDPTVSPRPPLLQSPLFTIHIVSVLFAYASFALAFVLGVTYVLLFKEIRAKHLGFFYARLPSLQSLDTMNARVVTIGWVFLTIGIAVGGIWATQVQSSPDPRAQNMSVADPKIMVALVCWAVYAFAFLARRAIGWSGRRAAWLTAIAFVIVLLNFVPIGFFLTKSHNF